MKEICRKCGTTENVNFEGMCKNCYTKSVEEAMNKSKNNKDKYNKEYNHNKIFIALKKNSLIIESSLTILVFTLIIAIVVTNKNYKNTYNEIKTKYEDTEKKLNNSSVSLEKAQSKISELNQDEKQKEINAHIKTLETTQAQLENKKQELENQVKQLNEDVVKLKGEPKMYPAGQLKAGTDIPIGKYKIYDGNSNFTVYSSSGNLEVNIILGKGSYSVSEYIYTFKTGDKIKANSSFKLVEVQ